MTQSVPAALAIHTTSSSLGLCLSHPPNEVSIKTWDLGRDLSSQLHPLLRAFMQPYGLDQLDFMAVATGPGGFTSTRIGVVTARTLAQQLNLPLFGISSLAAFAWNWAIASSPPLTDGTDGPAIAIQMPARREQIFAAIYRLASIPDIPNLSSSQTLDRGGAMTHPANNPSLQITSQPFRLQPYQPEQVLDLSTWQQQLSQFPHDVKVISIEGDLGHTAIDVLALAWQAYQAGCRPHWSTVQPFYGQSPV
ncbi:MAG: tRNA (adenosine(37)-N6)-threonylcarbamoyltransferase complex dimerization subunit type 1 TsaB [Leptolyngbyaceae bacterium]|nr:tRNA (adenosine(37)-N6)-threonylcarbamoyltransferase complex dimerization subunit type 1 TsaB [Leptolyngbyaceae bacterium]